MHHVTHGRRRAPVARDRLADHRERDVVLAQAAVLLGHGEREEAVLAHQLEVAARVQQLVVGALRVRAHLLLAELDERLAQLLLAIGQDPVRVPLVAEAPERLAAPLLLVRHRALLLLDQFVHDCAARFIPQAAVAVHRNGSRAHPSGATQTRHGASRADPPRGGAEA